MIIVIVIIIIITIIIVIIFILNYLVKNTSLAAVVFREVLR